MTSTRPKKISELDERVDPIEFDVVRNALIEITEEMGFALRRSAYSTNIKTRADFSCVVFDHRLRFLASGFAQATHLGSMVHMVPAAVRLYGPENIHAGAMLMTNDPYAGGVHLNDICIIAPVYYNAELFGYVANIAHHVDVGGGAPASIGAFREIYQEGVNIPPVKVVANGAIVSDVLAIVVNQIRAKRETAGDIRAQIAANNTGAARLRELLDRYGVGTIGNYIDVLLKYTEQRTRSAIRSLPQGAFSAEGHIDTDGFGGAAVRLAVAIRIEAGAISFDFSDSEAQRRAPVNATYAQTLSACAYVLKCLIDPDIAPNDGFYRAVDVKVPAGTVLNATHPYPVVGGFETHARLVDVMLRAFADAMPEQIPAGTKAMMCHAGFGAVDPSTGEYYCFLETLAGGYGARYAIDGPDAVQTHGQNTQNAPIEETELNYPVRIVRYELVDDSGGPGTWRGGLGVRRDYLFPDRDTTFTILADRDREGPHGLFGGGSGQVAEYVIIRGDSEDRVSSKTTVDLIAGDVVSYRTCGGGGYGAPTSRDAIAVLGDVSNRKVSLDAAREAYGVVIDAKTWTVNAAETDSLRRGMDQT